MTAVAELTIEARAAAGAAFLDDTLPGWIDRINLDDLDAGTSECCPLGQLYGSWDDAPRQVAMEARLGFYRATKWPYAPPGCVRRDDDVDAILRAIRVEYAALTEAWRALIERRRAEAGAA